MAKISQFLLWPMVYIFCKIICKTHISGRENLKKINKPFIIVSNHFSFYDSFLFRFILGFSTPNLPLRFMAVTKFNWSFLNFLSGIGLIRFIYKIFGVMVVTPGLGIEKNLKEAKQAISNGQNVVIYPEGSISTKDNVAPFKKGAAILAIESNAPILPVCFNMFKKSKSRNRLFINIGEPIKVSNELNPETFTIYLHDIISKLYDENKKINETIK